MSTIVALASSAGRSAIGVVRLSGPESLQIMRKLVGADFDPDPTKVLLRTLTDPQDQSIIDRALLTYFRAPHSFTGEDVVEISCHGSPIILRQVVDITLRLGARLADRGEFSMRALANKKLNLSQAEAIRDLIDARTADAAKQAVRQLGGELSARLASMKDRLLEIIVILESALEFVEDDLPEAQMDQLGQRLQEMISELSQLSATFSVGHLLSHGVRVAIVGRPNVGKSSVFNRLLGMERAIVTDIPGTTRDSISESINVNGIPISFIDTAGVRVSGDAIETMGIERTRQVIADADLTLVVIDGSAPLMKEDFEVLSHVESSRKVAAVNKCDLSSFENPFTHGDVGLNARSVRVSALSGEGLEELRAAILEPFSSCQSENEGLLITNARHYDLLRRTENELVAAVELVRADVSEELVLVGLHNALRFLDEITGETTAEDILSRIFSTFCIGK
jgi:tRNA modification GTPase